MQKSYQRIDAVIRQSNRWIKFGIISPISFFVFALILNYAEIIDISETIWIAGIITGVVCFTWWFWALKVIINMSELNKKATEDLTETIKSIRMVKDEVRQTTEEMREIINKKQRRKK